MRVNVVVFERCEVGAFVRSFVRSLLCIFFLIFIRLDLLVRRLVMMCRVPAVINTTCVVQKAFHPTNHHKHHPSSIFKISIDRS